jgi:hypothetical protein
MQRRILRRDSSAVLFYFRRLLKEKDAGFDPGGHPPLKFASWYCLSNNPKQQNELASMVPDKSLKVNIEKEFDFSEEGVKDIFSFVIGGKAMGEALLKVGK